MDLDCDLWSKTESDDDEMTLAIIPPLEKACVDSVRDSDASDDLNEGLTHLPRRLLNSICSTNILSYNSKLSHQSEQESQHEVPPTKKLKKKKK